MPGSEHVVPRQVYGNQQLSPPARGSASAVNPTQIVASGGGALPAGVPIVRAFPFNFNTPGLLTGLSVYTPTVNDLLLNAWISVDEGFFGGTTPQGDFSQFFGTNHGLFDLYCGGPVDMTFDGSYTGTTMVGVEPSAVAIPGATQLVPAKFLSNDPIRVVVSQDGTNTGADPGCSQGSATLYLVTLTPTAASFPDFMGTGTPNGHQTATAVGQWYEDTATGALYNFRGTAGTNTGWVLAAGYTGTGFGILDPYGNGIYLHEQGGGGITLNSEGGGAVLVESDSGITLDSTSGAIEIETASDNIRLDVGAGGDLRIGIAGGNLRIFGLPTSSAGLPSGSVWSNGGVLTIVP